MQKLDIENNLHRKESTIHFADFAVETLRSYERAMPSLFSGIEVDGDAIALLRGAA
jgi:hypothetical protein